MKDVLSVRLNEEDMRRIRLLSKSQKRGGSSVARDLIECGWTFVKLREYRQGKLSLGRLAEDLGLPLAAAIDLLAEIGVTAPIEYEDYLRGFESLAPRRGRSGRRS
jgi:hypothetical protein